MSTSRTRKTVPSNRSYQNQLATALLSDLGLAEALRWCQEYGWNGVADVLLNQRDTHH